jgi:hypothetical protein
MTRAILQWAEEALRQVLVLETAVLAAFLS